MRSPPPLFLPTRFKTAAILPFKPLDPRPRKGRRGLSPPFFLSWRPDASASTHAFFHILCLRMTTIRVLPSPLPLSFSSDKRTASLRILTSHSPFPRQPWPNPKAPGLPPFPFEVYIGQEEFASPPSAPPPPPEQTRRGFLSPLHRSAVYSPTPFSFFDPIFPALQATEGLFFPVPTRGRMEAPFLPSPLLCLESTGFFFLASRRMA